MGDSTATALSSAAQRLLDNVCCLGTFYLVSHQEEKVEMHMVEVLFEGMVANRPSITSRHVSSPSAGHAHHPV